MSCFIEMSGVRKRYGDIEALSLDKLSIERGHIVAVVGPNGSGKTTLLNLLALLDCPSVGTVRINDVDVDVSSSARSQLRKQITMVSQNPYMFRGTVEENIFFGLRVRAIKEKEKQRRLSEAVQAVGLHGFEKRSAQDLSAGEIQRVGIARALAIKPALLLLDEPTVNVDQAHVKYVERAIQWVRNTEGATVILATHSIDVGISLADDVISLADGKLTDLPLRNHFSGIVVDKRGEKIVEIGPGIEVRLTTDKAGKIHFAIDPYDIIVSLTPLESSARNVMAGTVLALNHEEDRARITIDTGARLDAIITLKSLEEMKLGLGKRVFAVFKTSSVKVF